ADAAEIHGPGIETIDAGPGFAAVGGFVDAAVLEAVTALAVLDIFRLTAQDSPVRSIGRGTTLARLRRRSAGTSWTRRRRRRARERQLHFHYLAASLDLQLDFVIDLVRLHFILHIFIRVNRLVIDGRNDVA